ncbi:hypothetical protein Y032_0168g198 [Ancylostoma ceylanicum]|uniref:Uncharacterized protein n=1 Tax=Ancylostoma ceylanicum TaxID=53326 RepID=A0A016SWL6_9BILA|nr:hypothetical protein Y032_0168g198 [Ancylostoma ceylanicum]
MPSDATVYKIHRWRRRPRLECAPRVYCRSITRPNNCYYNSVGPLRSMQRLRMKSKVQEHCIPTNHTEEH